MNQKIINLGILAHVDAGKTTLTEAFLMHSGVKSVMGRVDDGTTVTDFLPIERRRGMTVRAATVSFEWNGCKINLIDTPGHMDFIAEVMRTLSVLDGVILVVSAKESVQVQTREIFKRLRELKLPVLFFVNKLDRTGVDPGKVICDIKSMLTPDLVVMQEVNGAGTKTPSVREIPIDDRRITEPVVLSSEKLFAEYSSGGKFVHHEIARKLYWKVRDAKLFPVYFGSALSDIGTTPIMNAVTDYFSAEIPQTGVLSGLVYKAAYDEKSRKKLFVRLFSGELKIRENVDVHNKESVRIKSLYRLHNGTSEPCETVSAGDIAVLTDTEALSCGDILGTPCKLRTFTPAEPLLTASVTPSQGFDRYALISALKILNAEDPSLGLSINSATEEITLRLYGKLQTEVIQNILSERFGIESVFSPVRTIFKARPKRACFAEIRIGRTFFPAGIALSVTPLPVGSGFVYENHVDYGYLEKPFQNAVLEGILKGLAEGVGNEIVDVKVTFLEADYDSVSGTPAAFRSLAPFVVKKALETVEIERVEPWQKFELFCPAAYEKRVVSDLIALRAEIDGITHDSEIMITGLIPLDNSKDYSADLLIKTGGKGVFFTQFYGYLQ